MVKDGDIAVVPWTSELKRAAMALRVSDIHTFD